WLGTLVARDASGGTLVARFGDGGRRKKSDERHWGASARGPAERERARPPAGSRADFFRSPESRPTYWPP
ncbi:hypothetical protein GPALN_014132, partial [Globodera pallida]